MTFPDSGHGFDQDVFNCYCTECQLTRESWRRLQDARMGREALQIDLEVSRVPEARKTLYGRLKPFLEFLAVGAASVVWLAVIGFCLMVVFADLSR